MVYEIKITLIDVGVPVWRKVRIDQQATFYDLHELIQVIFDWTTSHLYDFKITDAEGNITDKVQITSTANNVFQSSDRTIYEDKAETLEDWFQVRTKYMSYTYDYGDNWNHQVEFIQEIEWTDNMMVPVCIDAYNYAPPEDSHFGEMEECHLIADDNGLLMEMINSNLKHYHPAENEKLSDNQLSKITLFPNVDDGTMIEELLHIADDDMEEGLHELAEQEEWELTLHQAKSFLQAKPWEKMQEQDIFALRDPFSGRYIFCSVLGHSHEQIGLAIYYGIEGFLLLLESFSGEPFSWEDMQQQHTLFLTFENREDLEKDDYELIRSHNTTFRGKKSWPSFTSFQPGYAPWVMEGEEVILIRLVMEETLAVMTELELGQVLPQLTEDEKILVRQITEDTSTYKSEITYIDELLHGDGEEVLALSEIEIKRLNKVSETLPLTMEFSIMSLDIPVQIREGDRPFFPLLVMAADADSGIIYYQDMMEVELHAYQAQKALLDTFVQMNGIPELIIVDPRTARFILPILDVQELDIEIEEKLDVLDFILEDMHEFMIDESEEP